MNYKVDRLYSYIVTHDTGFAPNPFWGKISLACCKPKIRTSVAKNFSKYKNIWIIGLSPAKRGNEIIFIMKAKEFHTFSEYYKKYPQKRPYFDAEDAIKKCGDNVYKPIDDKITFQQLHSYHSKNPFTDDWAIDERNTAHDLGGKYVLLSDEFIYYGNSTLPLKDSLKALIVGRGHRNNFERIILNQVETFINDHKEVIQNGTVVDRPHKWPQNDTSWKQGI